MKRHSLAGKSRFLRVLAALLLLGGFVHSGPVETILVVYLSDESERVTISNNGKKVFAAPGSERASATKKGKARLHLAKMRKEGGKHKMTGPEMIVIDGTTIPTMLGGGGRRNRDFYLAPGLYYMVIDFNYVLVDRYSEIKPSIAFDTARKSSEIIFQDDGSSFSITEESGFGLPTRSSARKTSTTVSTTALSGNLEVQLLARAGFHYYLEIKGRFSTKKKIPLFFGDPTTPDTVDICLVESESRSMKKPGKVVACANVSYSLTLRRKP